ncbi:hypothetical protein D9M73_265170 [compost metagenome]
MHRVHVGNGGGGSKRAGLVKKTVDGFDLLLVAAFHEGVFDVVRGNCCHEGEVLLLVVRRHGASRRARVIQETAHVHNHVNAARAGGVGSKWFRWLACPKMNAGLIHP